MSSASTPASAPLPLPFTSSSSSPSPSTPLSLITQGAEAHLYQTTFLTPTLRAALKIRPPKTYRHPTLDRRLTRARVLAEARVLAKCQRAGVRVPGVLGLDAEQGWLCVEWIEGGTVRDVLRGWGLRRMRERGEGGEGDGEEEVRGLLRRVGEAVGRLHDAGVVHGDLTTSNLMVRRPQRTTTTSAQEQAEAQQEDDNEASLEGEIVLIDFGLAQQAVQEEERAVDLYVLERAFGSTHPREEGLFAEVLEAYARSYKGARATLKRLEDVRMRGRKKSMLG